MPTGPSGAVPERDLLAEGVEHRGDLRGPLLQRADDHQLEDEADGQHGQHGQRHLGDAGRTPPGGGGGRTTPFGGGCRERGHDRPGARSGRARAGRRHRDQEQLPVEGGLAQGHGLPARLAPGADPSAVSPAEQHETEAHAEQSDPDVPGGADPGEGQVPPVESDDPVGDADEASTPDPPEPPEPFVDEDTSAGTVVLVADEASVVVVVVEPGSVVVVVVDVEVVVVVMVVVVVVDGPPGTADQVKPCASDELAANVISVFQLSVSVPLTLAHARPASHTPVAEAPEPV